jgi:ribonuclease Z
MYFQDKSRNKSVSSRGQGFARAMMARTCIALLLATPTFALPSFAAAADPISYNRIAPEAKAGEITVTLLGTGTPDPRIDRFGPSTLVNVAGKNLLFDVGRGAIVRLSQIGVSPGQLDEIFLTHYHSDHINGLPDLWLTSRLPPHGNRKLAQPITGPAGLTEIVDGLREVFANDIKVREADEKLPPAASTFDVTEFDDDGVVYDQDGVTVTAFKVNHGAMIHPAYGYRVDYKGHSVTLGGDTKYNENLIAHAKGTDLLIHEVAVGSPGMQDSAAFKRILDHHTSPELAGKVFTQVNPKLAVYSHIVTLHAPDEPDQSDSDLIAATRVSYDGPLDVGADLMAFEIGANGVTQGFAGDPGKPYAEQ